MRIRSLILGTLVTGCALALTSACGSNNKHNGGGGSGGTGGAAGAAGAAGASGASGSGGAGSGDCSTFATAACNELQQCSAFLLQVTYGDLQTCVTRTTQTCTSATTAKGASVSPAQFTTCANAFSQFDCGEFTHGIFVPSECAVAGSRAGGDACGSDDQCKSSYCAVKTGICGKCAARAAAGGACASDDGCQSGLVCSQGKCAQPVQAGGSCTNVLDCKVGLLCVSGKCTAPLAAGATCTKGACDPLAGLFCNPSTNKCEQIQVATDNQPCGVVGGKLTYCAAGGFCTATASQPQGTCTPHADDKTSCDATAGPTCMKPALCVLGTCTLPDPANCG